ncbi:MAG: winged helix-turn-helix transcriptional regulator [Candidatus Aminicenantes bacterium]|nr:winged helix-turn-helix transcriptional regulator [Candidatus Aminicenantes bacterium]
MPDILRVFRSLADPTRLRIVRLLLQGDLCVCELMFVLDMAQSRVSHQLRILRDAGLVEDARDGQWIIYHMPKNIRATIAPLLALFGEDNQSTGADQADRRRLSACLKEGIRKKKCLLVKSLKPRAERTPASTRKRPAGIKPQGDHHGN